MASFEQTKQLFSAWTVPQLRDYIRASGGNTSTFLEKSELVAEAARLSLVAEQQRSGVGPAPASFGTPYPTASGYPPVASAYPPPASAYPSFGSGYPPASSYPPPSGAYPPPSSAYPPPVASTDSFNGYPPSAAQPSAWGAAPPPSANPWGASPSPPNPYGSYGDPSPYGAPAGGQPASVPPPYGNHQPQSYSPPTITQHPPQAGGYPGQTGGYPGQTGGYPSQTGGYPGQAAGGYPSQTGGYPGQAAGGYPGQTAGYPSQTGGHPRSSSLKKALLIGCNYPGTQATLKGCINDAQCMEYLLKTKFGYQAEGIVVLRDDTNDPNLQPTRANIMSKIYWLVSGAQPGQHLFFHFSGHGSQVRDYKGEESDGMNETICPTDFRQAGMIVDDELNQALCNPLPPGVVLHAVVDACHSGTALDLPYRCKAKFGKIEWKAEYASESLRRRKGTAGGEAIQISAARDSQTAADTNQLSGSAHTGAATFAFIQSVEKAQGSLTYRQLLTNMHTVLDKSGSGGALPFKMPGGSGGLLGSLVGGLLNDVSGLTGQSGQTPVMSSNTPFNLDRPLAI